MEILSVLAEFAITKTTTDKKNKFELSVNDKKEGLWLRALTKSKGDEAKTKALYIKMRVEEIKNIEEGKIVQEQQELMKGEATKIDNKY